MKKLVLVVAILAAVYSGWRQFKAAPDRGLRAEVGHEAIALAFRDQASGVQVTGEGVVEKILSDDKEGSRHQRFIVRLSSDQTILISHNIDLAPRLPSLEAGDSVAFHGVYEWNSRGGVVHWTHRDPNGRHEAGWLRHDGETFQ